MAGFEIGFDQTELVFHNLNLKLTLTPPPKKKKIKK